MKLTNQIVKEVAYKLGFDLIGFSEAVMLNEETDRLKSWLEKGYFHKMSYMEKNVDKRTDVKKILSSAKSVISLGINYYKNDEYENGNDLGKVSRYAWGKDYHLIIWDKLKTFSEEIKSINSDAELISYVDTGPVMDKAWAVRSGLGWLGKHTNVISREIGSWFFIATVITNLEFEASIPQTDLCGTCTACIDACPTNAIIDEYVLDAGRCISNLTIENKCDIPKEFSGKFDNWVFGCDICQEVCPWNNKFAKTTTSKEFLSTDNKELNFGEIKELSNSRFRKRFFDSPILRAGLKGLKRNVEFIEEGNQ